MLLTETVALLLGLGVLYLWGLVSHELRLGLMDVRRPHRISRTSDICRLPIGRLRVARGPIPGLEVGHVVSVLEEKVFLGLVDLDNLWGSGDGLKPVSSISESGHCRAKSVVSG